MPIVMLAFSSDATNMKLFNKTIVELSKKMEATGDSRYSGMTEKAEKLYKNTLDENRLKETQKNRIN
jgi:hypothetical protein